MNKRKGKFITLKNIMQIEACCAARNKSFNEKLKQK